MKIFYFILLIGLIFFSKSAQTEEKRVGDYIVYYNAFNSSFIQPEVAKTYKIPRTGTTGVLNVSIHRANDKSMPDAISANVQGRAKNLLSQYEDLAFREIKEDAAIYYLADFQFRSGEESDLFFNIRIPGKKEPIEIKLSKKIFKD